MGSTSALLQDSSLPQKMEPSEYNAFVAHAPLQSPGSDQNAPEAPATAPPDAKLLQGMRVAIKDLYDMKGYQTGFGSPVWLETHQEKAEKDAPVVDALLSAGGIYVGKTQMDELAYSLNGENIHYGTPVNPAAPGRIPGGSSSGSVVAVAAGLADCALGSDTGGSVRVPASYCGIFGMRPTWNRISMEGARPLSPSFDTAGMFAKSSELLRASHLALLQGAPANSDAGDASLATSSPWKPTRTIIATDAFDLATAETRALVESAVEKAVAGGALPSQKEELVMSSLVSFDSGTDKDNGLGQWLAAFQIIQAWEAWECHGEWVTSAKPNFGPGIKDRFLNASKIPRDMVDAMKAEREKGKAEMEQQIIQAVDSTLKDAVLIIPTAPAPAPLLNEGPLVTSSFRNNALSLTCISGLSRTPQISLPVASISGQGPIGMSIIGKQGSDEALLDICVSIASVLGI